MNVFKRSLDHLQSYRLRINSNLLHLPPPKYPNVIKSTVYTPVIDNEEGNVELIGTLFEPKHREQKLATILIRTPYNRHTLGVDWAYVFASHGYAVLLQDTRGRFGSGGDFFPVKHEIKDGGETVHWIKSQEWSNQKVATFGVSYLGLTALAAIGCEKHGHLVDATLPIMAASNTHGIIYPDGALALDLVLRWLWLVVGLMQEKNKLKLLKFVFPSLFGKELERSFKATPAGEQDLELIGKRLDYYQDVLRAPDREHEFWHDKRSLCDLSSSKIPTTHIVAGWHDFFMKKSFEDFERASSNSVCEMTVGPWSHWEAQGYLRHSFPLALDFFEKTLKSESPKKRESKIRVYILESNPEQWHTDTCWPPKNGSSIQHMYLNASGLISTEKKMENDTFRTYNWNPNDPTPGVGGPSFDFWGGGRTSQIKLKRRNDVLSYTSDPMESPMYVVGDIYAQLKVSSSNLYTDFFVKICDVSPSGKIVNICERLYRTTPESGWCDVNEDGVGFSTFRFKVSPIACVFKTGHCIEVLICGGAHPIYARNTGSRELIADCTTLIGAEHHIYTESRLELPLLAL